MVMPECYNIVQKRYIKNKFISHQVTHIWLKLSQFLASIGSLYKEVGILHGGCLTVKNYWGLLTGDDGVDRIKWLDKKDDNLGTMATKAIS